MTIDMLIEAMELLKDSGYHPDYKERLIDQTINELYNVRIETNKCRDIWHGSVCVLATTDVLELINHGLYNKFGKIMRTPNDRNPMYRFADAVHETPGFEYLSDDIIRDGYEYLNDLWHDNEQYCSNNPDGTFKTEPAKFKVLDYEYFNSGGHCMVGVFTVWLPDKNQTIYALTNEEGCTLATVDYIRNDLDIDDYDELMIESVDWGRVTGYEKYFDLYRYCLRHYTKSDCAYFGTIREIPHHLLTDDLQEFVQPEYRAWLEEQGRDVPTDGKNIIIDEDYK